MIFPLLLIVAGTAGIIALVLTDSNEPAAPISMPGPLTGDSGIPIVDLEIEALGRIIASEAGSGTHAEQRAIGWAARNRFRGKSVYSVEHPWRAQKGSNPPFSSARPASDSHLKLAHEILVSDQSLDPTIGATSFFEPHMQDIFYKAGELARRGETGDRIIDGVKLTDITRFKNYTKDAQTVRSKWAHGSTIYATAGRFEFWGNASLFAKRGGNVQTIVVGGGGGVTVAFNDIPDVLDLLPRKPRLKFP